METSGKTYQREMVIQGPPPAGGGTAEQQTAGGAGGVVEEGGVKKITMRKRADRASNIIHWWMVGSAEFLFLAILAISMWLGITYGPNIASGKCVIVRQSVEYKTFSSGIGGRQYVEMVLTLTALVPDYWDDNLGKSNGGGTIRRSFYSDIENITLTRQRFAVGTRHPCLGGTFLRMNMPRSDAFPREVLEENGKGGGNIFWERVYHSPKHNYARESGVSALIFWNLVITVPLMFLFFVWYAAIAVYGPVMKRQIANPRDDSYVHYLMLWVFSGAAVLTGYTFYMVMSSGHDEGQCTVVATSFINYRMGFPSHFVMWCQIGLSGDLAKFRMKLPERGKSEFIHQMPQLFSYGSLQRIGVMPTQGVAHFIVLPNNEVYINSQKQALTITVVLACIFGVMMWGLFFQIVHIVATLHRNGFMFTHGDPYLCNYKPAIEGLHNCGYSKEEIKTANRYLRSEWKDYEPESDLTEYDDCVEDDDSEGSEIHISAPAPIPAPTPPFPAVLAPAQTFPLPQQQAALDSTSLALLYQPYIQMMAKPSEW